MGFCRVMVGDLLHAVQPKHPASATCLKHQQSTRIALRTVSQAEPELRVEGDRPGQVRNRQMHLVETVVKGRILDGGSDAG